VLREGESLKKGAIIATSSARREAAVRQIREDVIFVDIRGTVNARLEALHAGKVDGVVLAEAALIRLKKTHLNRVRLGGETAPLQGQLAVVTRAGDTKTIQLFLSLDTRAGVS